MSDTLAGLGPQVQEMLDKQAIHDVMMRYCRGVDRFDAEMINSAYHPDAYDDHSGKIFTGATIGQDIVEWLRPTLKIATHHITTQSVEVHGDAAGSEAYYNGWHLELRDGVERTMHTVGRYVDRLERRNGEWRISNRLVVLELAHYLVPEVQNLPFEHLGRHDRSDPSYGVFGG